MEKFFVQLPLTGEYLTTVRLTTGGLCALVGFDVDTTEDFKVCVTESLLILKRNGYLEAAIEFVVGERLACTVQGLQTGGAAQTGMEDDISRALLSALVRNVQFINNQTGAIEKIIFEG